ncbi:hypothetical protein ACFYNY_23505 [Streptomyces sp. NPDC006530]|uniref:hypothetical protein n=1 Tax=Streptomyces sp. NPDC006530 TaxID=3364750 RepID=UPI0036B9A7FD
MLTHGFEPLASYPGSADTPWRSRCAICETDLGPGPTLRAVCRRTAPCPVCARRDISPLAPGYLYLMVHDHLNALHWGIANSTHSAALRDRYRAWTLVQHWQFTSAQDAWAFGYQMKLWIRGQGYPPAPSVEATDPAHCQESASLDDLPLDHAVAWVDDLVCLMDPGRQPHDTAQIPPNALPL